MRQNIFRKRRRCFCFKSGDETPAEKLLCYKGGQAFFEGHSARRLVRRDIGHHGLCCGRYKGLAQLRRAVSRLYFFELKRGVSEACQKTNARPFSEMQTLGRNSFWGDYGLNKIAAEQALFESVPNAYIVRPPYLYGAKNNVYREAFCFECADLDRKFYVPRNGKMNLQFFSVRDLCRAFEAILKRHPSDRIFNVGNEPHFHLRLGFALLQGRWKIM